MKIMSGLREIKKLKSWFESNDENMKIGWYSEKQRNCIWRIAMFNNDNSPCAHVYLTPEGKEVIVTEVTDGLTTSSVWDDMKMVGPVIRHLGSVRNIYSSHVTFH